MTVLPLAEIVDVNALLETSIAAVVAGVGVALTFSLAILGVAQSAEASRDGRNGLSVAFAVLAALGGLATLAAIAFGIAVMTSH